MQAKATSGWKIKSNKMFFFRPESSVTRKHKNTLAQNLKGVTHVADDTLLYIYFKG